MSAIPTYESIGVRPLINCMGTYTIISGSLMLPEAREAMEKASRAYVNLDELMEKVGERIAELMQIGDGDEWMCCSPVSGDGRMCGRVGQGEDETTA